jgi:hypothetical protein
MAFLLDSNVLIEAKNRYYAFDICPGFWDWLSDEHDGEQVLSIKAVRDEVVSRADELAAWVAARSSSFFLTPDQADLVPLATLATWVNSQKYRPAAVAEFLQSADYYLIASAMAHKHIIVTHETPSDAIKRVKIPEPCIAHNVECINPFTMLRRLGVRFVREGT